MRPDTYPKHPTEEESDAGFRVTRIESRNSLHAALMGLQYAEVVAYPLSDSDLIIRVKNADDGSPQYMLYRWGFLKVEDTGAFEKTPRWHVVDSRTCSEPGRAIQCFQFELEDKDWRTVTPHPFQTFA